MRMPIWTAALIAVAGAVAGAAAQAPPPTLNGDDPPGWYRSAIYPPVDYSSPEVNASLQAYPFVQFNGDIRLAFRQYLLGQLVDPRYRETSIVPGARMDSVPMQGADIVLRARFQENAYGQPHERMRMAIIVGTSVAIVDAQAVNLQSWQHILPQLNAFWNALRIVPGASAPAYSAPAGPAAVASGGAGAGGLAGLYEGMESKFVSGIYGMSGTSYTTQALYYYLFSADGRVYRHYDELAVPGNDPARFDFNGAQRADPDNSGTYTIQGDVVTVRLGNPRNPKTFTTHLPKGKVMVIQGVEYTRQ